MKTVYIVLFIGIICIYLCLTISQKNFTCRHSKRLKTYEYDIISKFIKDEYKTAINYLDDPDATHFYIIEDGILVSYFHIILNREGKYYINYVYTNKNYRGKGIMKKLLQYALENMEVDSLYTWTKNTNQVSQHLFISSGFIVISRDKTDVVLMKRLK